jgi:hypothetical protein
MLMTQSLWMKGGLLLALLTILSLPPLKAQVRCGFDGTINKLRKEHPGFEESLNKNVRDYISKRKLTTARMTGTQSPIYYIPIVVHVIHTGDVVGSVYNPTDATIKGAIDYLNAVYNGTWTGTGGTILGAGDIQVQFVLATKDPAGNPSTGINRVNGSSITGYTTTGISTSGSPDELSVKNLSRWDPAAYYNVWVVNRIDGADGTVPGVPFTAGYAYFPMPNNNSAENRNIDGIVMLATQMRAGAKTLPHEIGHALSLYHPFQGETIFSGSNGCPANTSPATQGDYCADTDPVINPADDSYGATAFSCRTSVNSCSGLPYSDNTEKNFMNYTNCYQLFTNDQKARMQASAAITTRRGLIDSWANNQGSYPTTWSAPPTAAVKPVSSQVNTYKDWMGILNISLSGKKIFTLNAYRDGGYVDNAKWYNLFSLQPNTTYTMEMELLNSGNYEQVGLWIDYNGDGVFNDSEESVFYTNNYYNNTTAETGKLGFTFTTPTALSGNTVRMRIMQDFSSRYNGFTALTGSSSIIVAGQAEDYPVFLMNTTPMPVTLLEFSGRPASGRTLLTWKTAQELNAKEYLVQRSAEGSAFSTIGVVAAKGNTTGNVYQFTDFTFGGGTYFYRLKMVDEDGTYQYSNVLQFTTEAPLDVRVIGNPFREQIKVLLAEHEGPAWLRLLDATGKVYSSRTIKALTNTINFTVDPSLSKGLYILEVVVDGKRSVHKLVKE